MILACDFGGSSIKVVELDGDKIISRDFYPVSSPLGFIQELLQKRETTGKIQYQRVICTGGRSQSLPTEIGSVSIFTIPEMESIAQIARDCGALPRLVISAGTGIPFVWVSPDGKYKHNGGTSLGGGSLVGLGKRLLDISSFEELETLATAGNPTKVNMTVGDIVGSGIGILPADASASYFAKDGSKSEDIAAALFHMVAEPLSVTINILLHSLSLSSVIMVGRLMISTQFRGIIESIMTFYGKELIVPDHPEFAVLEGAISYYQKNETS